MTDETRHLCVGGPWHGRVLPLSDDRPTVLAPEFVEPTYQPMDPYPVSALKVHTYYRDLASVKGRTIPVLVSEKVREMPQGAQSGALADALYEHALLCFRGESTLV